MHDLFAELRFVLSERRVIENCACHRARMAARAVTRTYDDVLRPTSLRVTQLLVLLAIAIDGGPPFSTV